MKHLNRFCLMMKVLVGCGFASVLHSDEPVYLDPAQPMELRIQDLLDRLTLDEKAELMRNESNGAPRLGIPEYDWWNEALHGVARAGEATVFPQAIGLAAMWDDALMFEVADVISTEARAKYHEAIRKGIRKRYYGLTFWSPNINIFRDPRWGRGQETYGEDPFLTGRMGTAFVKGMQGDDPTYLKVAATAKHFAVHSGPEHNRYSANMDPLAADLHETYFPAFEMLIKEGNVEAVMTAYNALYNVPTTMNSLLFDQLDRWGFDGHVVSDCGAVYCIFEKFGLARDYAEAEALAVQAGLCLRCGDGDANLAKAVRSGLILPQELDEQLGKLLQTWFRLGFFDPQELVPYSTIPISENNTEAHSSLARRSAAKSLVLLKNDGVLPLEKSKLKRVLVIGPNADSIPVLLGNYNGTPSDPVTILDGLVEALEPDVKVDYLYGCDYVGTVSEFRIVPRIVLSTGDYTTAKDGDSSGLNAYFYNNDELKGEAVIEKRDHQLDLSWDGNAPADGVSPDKFSSRWTGRLRTGLPGTYQFRFDVSGGLRVYMDGELVVDAWSSKSQILEYMWDSEGADESEIVVEYSYDSDQFHVFPKLQWFWKTPIQDSGFKTAIAQAEAADVVIFAGGISAQLEGEDMRVDYEGFNSGDRTKIELPEVQQKLVEEIGKTGTPLVFVNLSGSAIAFGPVKHEADAILQAWYPGQQGGRAVADVLLGNTNPSGRLPVTFYESTEELPDFGDYRMAGRTYRYFDGEAAFPFGHGLSFTKFVYVDAEATIASDGSIVVQVSLENVGDVFGEEVVQVYLRAPDEANPREIRSLAGFQTVGLKPGELKAISIEIPAASFERWNEELGEMETVSGNWKCEVGASSSDIRETFPIDIP